MSQNKYQSDVVIVGGGLAGIVAGFELLNEGKKVLILDRDEEKEFGGLGKWAFGGMFFVDTPLQKRAKISDSKEQALKDWHSVARFEENDYWPKLWAEKYVNTCTCYVYNWLIKHNIRFFPVVHWVERGLERPGNTHPRFHMVWGTGWALVKTLAQHLTNHPKAKENLLLKYNHKVEEITIENGVVKGVTGTIEVGNMSRRQGGGSAQGTFSASVENVIVATGGIGGSLEKVRKHWHKDFGSVPETVLNGSHKFADGVLHDAVDKINGNITHLDNQWHYAAGVHHPQPHHPQHGLSLVPPKSALWLNYKGERIGPTPLITAFDTRFLVEQICKQEKKMSWQVLNTKIAFKEFAISGSEHNVAIRDKSILKFLKSILFGNKDLVNEMIKDCKDFVTANSVEELAAKMNTLHGDNDVDVNTMREVIKNYDQQIDLGEANFTDKQLQRIKQAREYRGDKVRTCKYQKIDDKSAYPLLAIRAFIVSRKTLGGIQTDLECRVLSKTETITQSDGIGGQPIPGLYAIGECAGFGGGGMHGIGALEGTFLGGCVLNGRVVAKTIVGKKLM